MNNELIKKAKLCKSKEELLKIAKENNFELSSEEAELYLQDFKEGEVSDAELDNVAGGQEGCADPPRPYEDITWAKKEDVEFIFNEGDIVQAFAEFCEHHTATVKVVSREIVFTDDIPSRWQDQYWLEKVPGCRAPFQKNWYPRSKVEKP